jgi:predicted amidohydrolase YtcJ
MSPQLKWFLVCAFAGVGTVILLDRYMPERADTIYRNGRIYTMNADSAIADALAIAHDKIIGIGTNEYIGRKFKAKNIIDLGGKTVLPGLIDAHCHLLGLGLARMTVDVYGTHSETEAAEKISQQVSVSSQDQWIRGRGWDQNEWQPKSFPTIKSLDRFARANPVYLARVDGHACW